MNIYLDNCATTRPHDEVIACMASVMRETYGNPSALHGAGLAAERLVREARGRVAALFGAEAERVLFTSGGTESNNTAILGCARARRRQGRRVIATRAEHPSVLASCALLAAEGFDIAFAEVDGEGRAIPASVEALLNEDTILISCAHVNNETGAIQPVEAICAIARDGERRTGKRIAVHVDAVQSFGKLPLDTLARRADLISVSGHKLHGPKGVGALLLGRGLRIEPLLVGGGQEGGLRSGTENVPAIAGFGLAAHMARENLPARAEKAAARKRLLLAALAAGAGAHRLNGPAGAEASPYILNVSFLGVKGEVLLHDLEQRGLCVSTGAACSAKKKGGSRVLAAMGLSQAESEGAIRFGFGDFNTEEEAALAAEAVCAAVARFRGLGRYR
ncbi:MAG: cysteine desulfurase [Clostridiales Family XIII bacterium]|jgi:cysteine desulfurase|nr:cysteine desulfurase [Clostridiales Family XIII bacterium]